MEKQESKKAFSFVIVVVFLLMIVGILTTGNFYYKFQQNHIKIEAEKKLTAVVNLKAEQIIKWRTERLGDTKLITHNAPLARQVEEFIKKSTVSKRKNELLAFMQSLKENGYESVLLINTKKEVLLAKSPHGDTIGAYAKQLLGEALQNKKIIFSDFHTTDVFDFPHIDIVIPIFAPDRTERVIIGIFFLRIDPKENLYPLLTTWQTQNRTSETILVKKDSNDVVFLTPLRHQKDEPLKLRFPISTEKLPAAMAVRGIEGIVEGVDYRGAPVIAAIKKIQETNWYIIEKIDKDEVYSQLQERVWLIGIGLFLLIVAAGIIIGLGWQRQRASFYKERYKTEIEKQALTRHYEYLVMYANDIIILADEAGNIISLNDTALNTYEYSHDEITTLNLKDLRTDETIADFEYILDKAKSGDGMVYETIHKTKSGKTFPVEKSVRMIDIDGKKFFQAIIRNITERKLVEKVLKESFEEIQDLYNNAPCGYHTIDNQGFYTRVNNTELQWSGYSREELIGKKKFSDILTPGSRILFETSKNVFYDTGFINNLELEMIRKDGTILPVSLNASAIKDMHDNIVMCRSTIYDITARKEAERKILRLNRTYALLSNINQMIVRTRDRQTLFNSACQIAETDGKFALSWIGILDIHSGEVIPASKAGGVSDYIENLNLVITDDVKGKYPIAFSIREGKHTIINNIVIDEAMATWKEKALLLGYKSIGAFPIKVFNKSIGAIGFYSDEIGFFDDAELRLLDELAMDLGYALEILELDDKRKQTEESLIQSISLYRATLESTADGILVVNEEGKITGFNEQFLKMWNIPNEIIQTGDDNIAINYVLNQLKDPTAFINKVKELYEEKEKDSFDVIEFKDGKIFERYSHPQRIEGAAIGRVWSFRDVSKRRMMEEALRESEESYKNLAEGTFEGVMITIEDKVVEANEQLAIMLGYESSDDIIDLSIKDFVPPESLNFVLEAIRLNQTDPYEHFVIKKSGTKLFMQARGRTIQYKGKKARMTALRDITKQKEALKELRESEDQFRSLAEQSPNIIFINYKGAIVYANKKCEEIMGYTKEEFYSPNFNFMRLIKEEFHDAIRANYNKHIKGEEVPSTEYILITKDGKEINIILSTKLIGYKGNTAILGTGTDITAQKQVENALRQSYDFNNLLLETIPFGLNIVDETGTLLFISKTMKEIAGTDVLGKKCWDVYKDNKQQCRDCPLNKDISFEKSKTMEVENVFGGKTYQISHIGLIYNGRKAILEVFQDVTEQKRFQQELIQNQKMLSIGTLAGGIAHDFNNLLGIILGYVSILYSIKDDQDKFYDGINAIKQAVERGAALVRQILTFARKGDVTFEPLSISNLIKELVSMLEQTFPKIITFKVSIANNLPLINADHTQIHQALLNLCVNSRDAMPNGGEITIQADLIAGEQIRVQYPQADENMYVFIAISDTGVGIDDYNRNRIFDPFFTTKEKGKGTGLGLSVAYGIVKSHHGFLDVESVKEKGTTFKIYFPVAQVDANLRTSITTTEKKFPGGTETILIVEDEELLLQMIQTILETYGYKVLTAKDGLEAIRIYEKKSNKIDLVLTDLGLPKLTGADEFIKLKEINKNVKVLIASGFLEPEDKTKLEQLGIKGFLQKPYVIEELLLKIRKAIE